MPASAPEIDPEDTAEGEFFQGIGGVKGKRELVSRDRLLASLTALIRTCEGCEEVTVISLDRLDPPDSRDGCNWSLALVLDPAGVAPEVYALAYGAIISTARETWNLEAPKS
jgi:hypothetical protein